MFYDITISALVTLIAVAPMAFAAWYDGRVQVPQD
jgi:DNA-binding transcriptional regulator YdaS (Cro superfamily)